MPAAQHIMIFAGEASGDIHGANLVKALKQKNASLRFSGMGSRHLANENVELFVDSSSIAVMGLVEVLMQWPEIKKALRTMETAIRQQQPDLLILIDYVEFNLRMAAIAKSLGIKVLFYVSPQVWAWRPERIHKIGTLIDHMAVIFPFEKKYYDEANIPATYVGHPLIHHVKARRTPEQLREDLGIANGQRIIGLLPGSRPSEIKTILPTLLKSAKQLNKQFNDCVFILPKAPSLKTGLLEELVQKHAIDNLHLIEGDAHSVMQAAQSVMIASGTATLETALLGTPMVVVYKVNVFSWLWMKSKLQIPNVSLANIVAGERIVPELIQNNFTVNNVVHEVSAQLNDNALHQQIKTDLAKVKASFGDEDCAENVSTIALDLLR